MASIVQLTDRKRPVSDASIYPITDTLAVFDAQGRNVESRLVDAENDYVNVNEATNTSSAFASKTAARNAVPSQFQKVGITVTYLLSSGWIVEQYKAASATPWSAADADWQAIGPVTISNNTVTVGDSSLFSIDDEPINGSNNLVKSGGVFNDLALGAVYDVSAKNPTAGPNNDGKWESLSALLSDANLSTLIPTAVRKGGMSIKFVCSSDNKYVQYRLTKDEFSVNENDWVEDNIVNVKASHSDFSITDEKKNAIVRILDGEIKTKNFNSADWKTKKAITDFEIVDDNGNAVVAFDNGDIRTKNFNSKYILSSVFSKYDGKKLSILGDSISTYGVPDASNQNGTYCYSYYPTATCRYSRDGGGEGGSIAFDVNDMYWMKLINATGMVLGVNESWRGTFISGSSSSALNNQTRINHLGENGNPDVILIYGGTNDVGNGREVGTFNTDNPENYTQEQIANLPVNTFADGFRTMLIRVMKKYPNAEVVVILPTFVVLYSQTPDYNEVLDNYLEVIKEACDFFGIKYIDARCTGITLFNKQNYIVSDGVHPNKLGMDLLYKKIYKNLIFD